MACLPAVDPAATVAAVTARTGDTDSTRPGLASNATVTPNTSHAAGPTRSTAVATDTTVTACPDTRQAKCWASGAAVTAEPAGAGDTVKTAGRTTITAGPTVTSDSNGQERSQQHGD